MKTKKFIINILISILCCFSFASVKEDVLSVDASSVINPPESIPEAYQNVPITGTFTQPITLSYNAGEQTTFNINFNSCNVNVSGDLFLVSCSSVSYVSYDPIFRITVSGDCTVNATGNIFAFFSYYNCSLTLSSGSSITFTSNNPIIPAGRSITINNAIDEYGHTKGASLAGRKNLSLSYLNHTHSANSERFVIASEEYSPTWSVNGQRKCYYCNYCSKDFVDIGTDYEFKNETNWIIPACQDYSTHYHPMSSTCTTNGHSEYYECSDCGRLYDRNYEETTQEAITISSLSCEHNWEWMDNSPSNCSVYGLKSHYHCTTCNAVYFAPDNTSANMPSSTQTTGLVTPEELGDKLGNTAYYNPLNESHSYQKVEEIPSTCTTDGTQEHYVCSECGSIAVLENNEYVETTLDLLTIYATGHAYGTPTYAWSEDYSSCVARMVCVNDPTHVIQEQATIVDTITQQCDCEHDELTTYQAKFMNAAFDYQYKRDVVTKLKTGHNYEITYEWGENNKICVATAVCRNNQNEIITEEVETNITVNQRLSCTESEIITYVATFENALFNNQIKENVLTREAIGHNYTLVFAKEATCVENGNIEFYYCSNCGQLFILNDNEYQEATIEEVTIYATGHVFTIIEEKLPDCMHEGNHIQYYCEHCHKYYESSDSYQSLENGSDSLITYNDPNRHTGNNHLENRVNPTTEKEGYSGDLYCECGTLIEKGHYLDKIVVTENEEENEEVKEILTDNISNLITNNENISEEEAQKVEDALEKIDVQQALTISETATQQYEDLADLFDGKSEEEKVEVQEGVELTKKEAEEIVSSAITSAVLISASEKETTTKVEEVVSSLPTDSSINLSDTVNDFYTRVMNEILYGNPNGPTKQNSKKRYANDNQSNGIDYSVSAETYAKALEFYDTSVNNMVNATMKVRECSGETLKEELNIYIAGISVQSFRDFDRAAADEEFYNMAYKAILISLQESTLANLEKAYNNEKVNKTGTALQEITDTYNSECEQVRKLHLLDDIADEDCDGCFEDMIFEVMRQKYVTLINKKYENQELTADEYNECLAYTLNTAAFEDEYKRIFRNWCLQLEDTSKVQISLEELSNAVIDNSVNKITVKKAIKSELSLNEIILISAFGVCLIALLCFLYFFNKKNGKGVN